MKDSRIPTQRSGLRISVQFNTRYACAIVTDVMYSAVRCENVSHYADGSTQGAIYHSNSVARSFAAWLTPSADDLHGIMKRLSYPITNVSHLREEREFFLRCRAAMSHAVTYANHRYIYAVIDSKLDFNARLIEQAERDALGHLATSGAWLT